MNGMNPEPGAVYSLASRFTCDKCGTQPEITAAHGRDPILITFECHGQRATKQFARSELVFQQHVFSEGLENGLQDNAVGSPS